MKFWKRNGLIKLDIKTLNFFQKSIKKSQCTLFLNASLGFLLNKIILSHIFWVHISIFTLQLKDANILKVHYESIIFLKLIYNFLYDSQ